MLVDKLVQHIIIGWGNVAGTVKPIENEPPSTCIAPKTMSIMAISRLKATVGVDPDYQFAKVCGCAHALEGFSGVVKFKDFINDRGDPMGGHECDHLRKHGPRANINAAHTDRFAHNIGWRNLSPGAGQNAN